MTIETYTRAQLARFSAEQGASYGGVNNMLAIAFILRNRVFAGWGTWLDVVEAADLKLANKTAGREDLAQVFKSGSGRILLNRIDEIYARAEVEDITGGALWWVDPSRPIEAWFVKEVMQRPLEHPRKAHIGPVWFFQ